MNFNIHNVDFKLNTLGKIVFSVIFFLMVLTTCFLYVEYNYFKKQSESMIELQEDYRTYICAVNKILVDYNRVKEELEQKSSDLSDKSDQKKKDKSLEKTDRYNLKNGFEKNSLDNGLLEKESNIGKSQVYFYGNFPKYSVVSSSDDDSELFCIVNRDNKHLRDTSMGYVKKYCKSRGMPCNISIYDYMDYTDCSIERIAQANRMLLKAKQARLRAKKYGKGYKKFGKHYRYNGRDGGPRKVSSLPRQNFENSSSSEGIQLTWPIKKSQFYFSSLFGPRKKRSGAWGFHYGVDMAAIKGTPVHASHGGIVVEARYRSGYGNTIVIAHSRKYRTRYAHLNKISVSVGQKVFRSDVIGAVGNTGYVRSSSGDGSHLHFEVIESGRKINPLPFLA